MKAFFEEKKWEALAREAHTAKSSALTFGMDEAGVLLKKIQSYTEQKDFDVLPQLIDDVVNQLEAAVPELLELKASL
jgi:HPt (histidine-containing phosphotransfer) domain-containing protein